MWDSLSSPHVLLLISSSLTFHSSSSFHCPCVASASTPLPANHDSLFLPTTYRLTSFCQATRRMDDESLEEQIRQTSEDSRALRELMEGERGKLRQSLEELQQLHSQVSTPFHSTENVHGSLTYPDFCEMQLSTVTFSGDCD